MKKWSEEAKLRNRARRLARRLFKRRPLYAYQEVKNRYPAYTLEQYLHDIRHKVKAPRSRRPPNGKRDYMESIQAQVQHYIDRGEDIPPALVSKYYMLQQAISEPWQVKIKFDDKVKVFCFNNRLDVNKIKAFTQYAQSVYRKPDAMDLVDTYYLETTKYLTS